MQNSYNDPVALLHALIVDLEKQYHSYPQKKSGMEQNIAALRLNAQRIRRNSDPDADKTIGFFGGQKRGKSSLINHLIGCDLMPVRAIPMSSVVIKAKQDYIITSGKYKVDITYADGFHQKAEECSLEDACELLKMYGSRLGNFANQVAEITVSSNFPNSEILKNGGILVDTPGAESAFGIDDPEEAISDNIAEGKNLQEAQRALDILDSTQVIVFCERADYLETKNSQIFYQSEMRKRFPVNVLNFKDKFEFTNTGTTSDDIKEEIKQGQMRHKMAGTFGASIDRIYCVSCKEATDGKKKNDHIQLQRSNLPLLEDVIIRELRKLQPQFGLIACLKELKVLFKLVNSDVNVIKLDRLLMENFKKSIENNPDYYETLKYAESFYE